ncbi:hypothetical protein ACJMK2_037477 [Sinanodonta woodiana]|uniref:Acidic fibroblast growth factor intracellular-binding protein n=1 Tax=Sinanodonta woodiana TaxID=1069815 RepID=A0ABD3WP01_SINWO
MSTYVDVFVGNFVTIDTDLYDMWLNGLSAVEAAAVLQKQGILQSMGARQDDLLSDTQDNYRLFMGLEKLLKWPSKFANQQIYQIDADTQKMLIDKYYHFDPVVVREILGRKLSSNTRKFLDDVCEKTKVPLRSCRRQFDNLKRVFKTVEEMLGSLDQNIRTHYLISDELAKQYAAIVFITNHRFETSKKKLYHLTLDDFLVCADLMITNWSYSAEECTNHEDMDVDLDRLFLQDLRDLKLLVEKDYMDDQKSFVIQTLRSSFQRRKLQDLDENFKNIMKAIINIAYGLNHSKEVRDFFVDLVEKLIEPCQQSGWTCDDIENFLVVLKDAPQQIAAFRNMPNLNTVWERYMNAFIQCTVKLYHT